MQKDRKRWGKIWDLNLKQLIQQISIKETLPTSVCVCVCACVCVQARKKESAR